MTETLQTQRRKHWSQKENECRNHETIHVRKENHIIFSQEDRLEESKVQNWESKQLIEKYHNKRHRIKRFYLCRSKISLWKNRGASEDHRQKVKTWMGNQVRIVGKKTTTTSKNTYPEHENIFGRNEK